MTPSSALLSSSNYPLVIIPKTNSSTLDPIASPFVLKLASPTNEENGLTRPRPRCGISPTMTTSEKELNANKMPFGRFRRTSFTPSSPDSGQARASAMVSVVKMRSMASTRMTPARTLPTHLLPAIHSPANLEQNLPSLEPALRLPLASIAIM